MISAGKEYASALFSLTEELGTTDEALKDVHVANGAFSANPSYIKLLDTPSLSVPEKLSLISEAFDSLDESLTNLLKLLCEKHSVYVFPKIAKEYEALYNESRGILDAEVISASELSQEARERLIDKLQGITGKKIVLTERIDKAIIGGLVVRYGAHQLDGSLRTRLLTIEKSLKSTVV